MRSLFKQALTVALLALAVFFAPAMLGGQAGMNLGTAYAFTPGSGPTYARAGGPNGVSLSQATAPQGFFGYVTLQPSNPNQAPASFALGQSAIVVYSSAQTPSAVNANTTAEQAFTVTGVAAGSVVHIQRVSAAQAGLGLVGARVSAANTVQANYCNVTAGNLTPTAESLLVVEFRGPLIQSITWSPTAVASLHTSHQTVAVGGATSAVANTTVQTLSSQAVGSLPSQPTVASPSTIPPNFTAANPSNSTPINSPLSATQGAVGTVLVSGAPQTVVVNKPTNQAGLGYFCWVADNDTLGVTFSNTSGAPITPTAAQAWTFFASRGVALHGCSLFRVNVGTLAAVAQATSAVEAIAVNGLATTDRIIGWIKPTEQAGLILTKARISAANQVTLEFGNIPAGGNLTPTASEVYLLVVDHRGAGLTTNTSGAVLKQYNGSFSVGAIATITGGEVSSTATGVVSGGAVIANVCAGTGFANGLGTGLPDGVIFGGCRASGANTLQFNMINLMVAAKTAAETGSAMFTALQAPTATSGVAAGAAGSGVEYPVDVQLQLLAENAYGQALAAQSMGAQAGS